MSILQGNRRNFLKTILATLSSILVFPFVRSSSLPPDSQEVPIKDLGVRAGIQPNTRSAILQTHFKSGTSLTSVIEGGAGDAANVMAFGAIGDGVNDDSVAIQNAVANHALIYFPPGIYVCNDIDVPANRCLFSSGGATLLITRAGTFALNLRGSEITLQNLRIKGGDDGKYGVLVELDAGNLSGIWFEQCTFTELWVAIAFKAETEMGRMAREVTITGCTFDHIRGKAIDMTVTATRRGEPYSLYNIRIEKNTFMDIAAESSGAREFDNFSGALYIGGLTSVSRFYLRDNEVLRVGPQFLAMSATQNPRVDFVVSGNSVRQQGTTNVIHMAYTFFSVDNLVFRDNSSYYVEFEHLVLGNCRNFKVVDCHFEDANVGIAVSDNEFGDHSWGEISNCTFVDIECPTDANNGNKAIFVRGDSADVHISNCRFMKQDGTKSQTAIDVNYRNMGAKWAKVFDTTIYQWTPDGATGYYLQRRGGADPDISEPVGVYENGNELIAGIVGILGIGQWGWGDNHALGYNTIYVQTSDSAAPGSTRITAGYPRPAINISNCHFERLRGIVVSSGGNINYPGHARITNCSFQKCPIAIRFTYPVGNAVAFCNFESCNTDVHVTTATNGLRCVHNLHLNTNPSNIAEAGAYLTDLGKGSSVWEITGCTFRNVKNIHRMKNGASLDPNQHLLIFRDNDMDMRCTGLPAV